MEEFHTTKLGMANDLYECAKPTFEALNGLCSLSYEAAKQVENCHELAMMFYQGSPEVFDCRERCCHDSSTYNASEPFLCGPEKMYFDGWFRPCFKPVPSQTLKDNACMRICTTRQYVKYTRWFCNQDAKAVFQAYVGEMISKYQNLNRCFEKCPMVPA
uniref:Uncharacterized protein n=1 Tax=Panagrellus redivivus TaxID=6233 RepID=A0A7E4VSK5_PANRE